MIADNAIQTALPVDVPQTKRCTKCGEVKAVGEFHKDKSKKDGHHSHCKRCAIAYLDAHKDESKAYYEAHKDKKRAYARAYNESHKDEINAYYDTHLIEAWVRATTNKHKKQGFEVIASHHELLKMARNTITCSICGAMLNWGRKETGHVVSNSPSLDRLYNGKRISKDNSWIICHHCNTVKHDRPMPEFVAYCKMVADKFGGEYL